jgi:hypothetical protein
MPTKIEPHLKSNSEGPHFSHEPLHGGGGRGRPRLAPDAGGCGWRPLLLLRYAAARGAGGWSSRSPDAPAARGSVEDVALPEEDGGADRGAAGGGWRSAGGRLGWTGALLEESVVAASLLDAAEGEKHRG